MVKCLPGPCPGPARQVVQGNGEAGEHNFFKVEQPSGSLKEVDHFLYVGTQDYG